MHALTRALFSLAGAILAGAAVGQALLMMGWLAPRAVMATFFVVPLVAPLVAAQHYRHHGAAASAIALGGLLGGAAMASVFGGPLLLYGLREGFVGIDIPPLVLLVGILPLGMAVASAACTAVLVRGVRIYRAKHGMVHAPR